MNGHRATLEAAGLRGGYQARCQCGWETWQLVRSDAEVALLEHLRFAAGPPMDGLRSLEEWLQVASASLDVAIEAAEDPVELVGVARRLDSLEDAVDRWFVTTRERIAGRLDTLTGYTRGQG